MSKVKIVKKAVKDQQMVDMFNTMISGDGDAEIMEKKEKELHSLISLIKNIMLGFANGPFKKFDEYVKNCAEFEAFATELNELTNVKYKELKSHQLIKQLVLVCRELVVYAQYLNPDNLQDKWILDHPGLMFEPFAFTTLDLKHIWNNEKATPTVRKYIMQVLSLMFNKCHQVYKIITSPDVDVKKFSMVIIQSINKVRTAPELSRCKEAFDKIEESVNLLENNFDDYYKDMIQSENPNTIIENFIVDVSQGQNMNLSLMRQFRQIINFYKKQSAKNGKIKDPKIKSLFDSLTSKMDIIEKKVSDPKFKEEDINEDEIIEMMNSSSTSSTEETEGGSTSSDVNETEGGSTSSTGKLSPVPEENDA